MRLVGTPRGIVSSYVPPPSYAENTYDSRMSIPFEYEQLQFSYIGVEREPKALTAALKPFFDSNGSTEEQIIEWMAFHLTKPANGVVVSNPLEYTFKYDPRAGFKICVPIGRNMNSPGFMFCQMELLYGRKPGVSGSVKEDFLFKKFDVANSLGTSPIWTDGNQWFRQYSYSKYMVAVFKVVAVNELLEVSSQGWTAANIFDAHGYVKYGNYLLPLVCPLKPPYAPQQYKEKPTLEMIQAMAKTSAAEILDNGQQNRLISYTKKYSSLNVRIFDARRELEIAKDPEFLDKSYIVANEKEVKKFLKYAKSGKLQIPENADEKEYLRQILPMVRTYLDLDVAI